MSTPQTDDITLVYPDSDGQPISDNTLQFRWIAMLKAGLDARTPDAFVAGDLLWYPVEGQPWVRVAPDVLVAFGRPKGYRGSYKQWEEAGVAPQVVFEIRSPSNTGPKMAEKRQFYEDYGVREYYDYDPDRNILRGWLRGSVGLEPISELNDWTSPLLGIRFQPGEPELVVLHRDNTPFVDMIALHEQRDAARSQAEFERRRADRERERTETERQRAETERERAETAHQRAETARQRAEAAEAEKAELLERLAALGMTLP